MGMNLSSISEILTLQFIMICPMKKQTQKTAVSKLTKTLASDMRVKANNLQETF